MRAALPDQGLSGYRDIELGTNIGTAVVAHAVLEERGIEATFLELGSDLADPDANQHAVRVPAADEAAARAIVVEVTTAS